MIDFNKKRWQWLLIMLLALTWGTSFILMKKGLVAFTNMQMAELRVGISFFLLLPLALPRLKQINKNNIKSLLSVNFLGTGIPAFLFATAQTKISSSLSGVLNSLTPLFTVIIGALLYSSRVKWFNLLGIFIAMIGTVGLFSGDFNNFINNNSHYAIFVVIATLFYGTNINEVKYNLKKMDSLTISALTFIFTGPIAIVMFLFSDYQTAFSSPDVGMSLGFIFLLALLSSVIGSFGWNLLLKYTSPLVASSVTYIMPPIAIMWGLLDGESISAIEVISILVILAGVYLVNKKSGNQGKEPAVKTESNVAKQEEALIE